MNDNLPDINFKEKKEKKRGIGGWLRQRLGLGGRSAMGEAGINPSAMNLGRGALGAGGKFGASSGIAGLLAGKAGLIATVAMVAVAGGVYLANNAPAPSTGTAAFSSDRTPDNYVPAILRSQSKNTGSSLDMFKETNKGAVSMEDQEKPKAAPDAKPTDASAEGQADPNAGQPGADQGGAGNMAQDMMGKLTGSMGGSLTSQLGGGSSKFSNMGGFGNKFGSGATGGKPGFSSGIGAGFSSMPKFDSRKGKMLAMKGQSRPVFSGAKAGAGKKAGPGAWNQAKGMRDMQKSYSGSNIDTARSTQDKAWEGSTGEGDASGSGAGLSDGGAGIVTSPSLDNGSGAGGGGGSGTAAEPVVPEVTGNTDASPWKGLPEMAMMMILLSAVLGALGAFFIWMADCTDWLVGAGEVFRAIGLALCAVALIMAAAAVVMGVMMMFQHGQMLLGTLYTIGGGIAAVGAYKAMTGDMSDELMINTLWMAGIAGAMALIGSMLGGK